MKKVYCVMEYYHYDTGDVLEVFSSYKKAEAFIINHLLGKGFTRRYDYWESSCTLTTYEIKVMSVK